MPPFIDEFLLFMLYAANKSTGCAVYTLVVFRLPRRTVLNTTVVNSDKEPLPNNRLQARQDKVDRETGHVRSNNQTMKRRAVKVCCVHRALFPLFGVWLLIHPATFFFRFASYQNKMVQKPYVFAFGGVISCCFSSFFRCFATV